MFEQILVVDDSWAARQITKHWLRIAGFRKARFPEATCGSDALKILDQDDIGLLVTNINMPGMNGLELIKRVRAREVVEAELPVLVISSAVNQHSRRRLISLGARDALSKPVDPRSLRTAIGKLTGRKDLNDSSSG